MRAYGETASRDRIRTDVDPAVARSLEEAGEQLLTFGQIQAAQGRRPPSGVGAARSFRGLVHDRIPLGIEDPRRGSSSFRLQPGIEQRDGPWY